MPDAAPSSARKILAGPRLKRLRRERGLTQARMAEELTVSPSYLNLMERNQRPITVPVLARLSEAYGIDPREFMEDQADAAVEGVEQILTDPIFRDLPVARAELHDAAEYAPSVVAAMRKLYAAYAGARDANEARVLASADPDRTEVLVGDGPIERVRAILQENRNHFPEIDDARRGLRLRPGAGRSGAVPRHGGTAARAPRHSRAIDAGGRHGRPAPLLRPPPPPAADLRDHGPARPHLPGRLPARDLGARPARQRDLRPPRAKRRHRAPPACG